MCHGKTDSPCMIRQFRKYFFLGIVCVWMCACSVQPVELLFSVTLLRFWRCIQLPTKVYSKLQ